MRLKQLIKGTDIMVINYTGDYFPRPFQHWVSLHPDIIAAGRPYKAWNFTAHSNRRHKGIDKVWNYETYGSDSGLFACHVALKLGYDKIILCGIPLDSSRKFFEMKEMPNHQFDTTVNLQIWRSEVPVFENKIRSMSGNTKEMLGAPTKEWLYE